jgi:hypothetical protein
MQRPAANAVLTTDVDTWGRFWTQRCPSRSSGLLRGTAVDSRGPGHSPEKRTVGGSAWRGSCPGLKSGLIRGRSVASGTYSFHRDVQVTYGGGHGRTHSRRLGKRAGRNRLYLDSAGIASSNLRDQCSTKVQQLDRPADDLGRPAIWF